MPANLTAAIQTGIPLAAPFALREQADPHWLLQSQGWNFERASVLKPVPLTAAGAVDPHVQLDAFQWIDISVFGIGNTEAAMSQMQAAIQSRGSDLYAWAIFSQQTFDALGVRIRQYRLVLVHSQVQLVGWALVLLAAAFAAVIFIQYLTLGQSPAVEDLKKLWGSAVTSVGDAAGNIGGAIATPYIVATVASGVILILLSRIGKEVGVRAPRAQSPRGSLSVKAGPATIKAGS